MPDKLIQIHKAFYTFLAFTIATLLQILMGSMGFAVVSTAHADTISMPSIRGAVEAAPNTIQQTSADTSNAISETSFLTNTLALTIPTPIETTGVLSEAVSLPDAQSVSSNNEITASTEPAQATIDTAYAAIISGTIIANRTEQQALFFVEGATYLLDPLRSIGLQLPRSTAAVNLYNCDARTPEDQQSCFWDPYPLNKDGFYEIVSGSEDGKIVSLILREAGAPPANKIYIQNRTGKSEIIVLGGQEIELQPASLREFEVQSDTPALLYLHNCVSLDGESVCEWAPRTATPGLYYALIEQTTPGTLPNSQVTSLELQDVLTKVAPSAQGNTDPNPDSKPSDPPNVPDVPSQPPLQMNCRTLVPTLNVRSGPGLQYTIIQKVRIGGSDPASVLAIGRDESAQWLAVSEKIAEGGWIIASSNFIQCDEDINTLPILEPTLAELQPTPVSGQAQQAETTDSETTTPNDASAEVPAEEVTPVVENPAPAVPEGYALIIVNNGFENTIRFTLDQQYRLEFGPSEFDLQPGESIQIVVIPGQIAFSASSPGRDGNADFLLERDQTRVMWLTFIPDPGSSEKWILQY